MGNITNDIINGIACVLCGVYFIDINEELYEHGYPVVCNECYEHSCGYQRQDLNIHTI